MDDGQDPLSTTSSSPQSERASSKLEVVDNGKWRQTCATMMLGIKSSLWMTMHLTLWTMAPVSTFMQLVLPHLTQHLIARLNQKSGSPHQQHLPFCYPATMMTLSCVMSIASFVNLLLGQQCVMRSLTPMAMFDFQQFTNLQTLRVHLERRQEGRREKQLTKLHVLNLHPQRNQKKEKENQISKELNAWP